MGGSQELSAEQWALTQCSYKFIWQLFHPIHEFYAFYSPSPHNWLYLWKHDYEMMRIIKDQLYVLLSTLDTNNKFSTKNALISVFVWFVFLWRCN